VRPVGGKPGFEGNGFVELDSKLYFYTDNRKPMYQQLVENSSLELTFLVSKGFVRVSANCVFEDNRDAKEAILRENPVLNNLYKADDEFLEVYFLNEVDAYLYSVGQAPQILA
jgi:uncharacterized pyridoxamine 5'-phosphate oxidase family protein